MTLASFAAQGTLGWPNWHSMVVFGDSLSDDGNGSFQLTNQTWPADRAYFRGHFSNGPVWVEWLASSLGLGEALQDRAYGGATVNNSRIQGFTGYNSSIPVPSTTDQVKEYLKQLNGADSDTLYLITGGSNDAFFLPEDADVEAAANASASDLLGLVEEVHKEGGRHVLISSLPCLESTPYAQLYDPSSAKVLTSFVETFRIYLEAHLPNWEGNSSLSVYDQCKTLRKLANHSGKYGYQDTTHPCLNGAYPGEAPTRSLCSCPNNYLFWDIYHPSTVTHHYMSKDARRTLLATYARKRYSRGPLLFTSKVGI